MAEPYHVSRHLYHSRCDNTGLDLSLSPISAFALLNFVSLSSSAVIALPRPDNPLFDLNPVYVRAFFLPTVALQLSLCKCTFTFPISDLALASDVH